MIDESVDIVGAITEQLVLLARQMDGVTDAGCEIPPHHTPGTLPYVFVEEGEATYSRVSIDTLSVSRDWLLLVYVQSFVESDGLGEAQARAACRPFLKTIPRHFSQRRLADNEVALNFSVSMTLTRDMGIQTVSRKGTWYAGVAFFVNVTYQEDLSEN